MKLSRYVTTLAMTASLALYDMVGLPNLTPKKAQAQSNRPYVILVNGNADCCVWSPNDGGFYMGKLLDIPNAQFRKTAWDHFQDGGRQRRNIDIGFLGSYSASNDSDFIRDASNFINNQLDPNRPLIIIGHSYGGDSVLKLAHRVNRRIQFLGVIDPVGAGGFRTPIRNHGVPSNVDYFFNRWQENGFATDNIVPFDSRGSGAINGCKAKTCDQQAQNLARKADGSEIRVSCESWEVSCPGYQPWPGGSNGTKAKRLTHNPMPRDAYIQSQILSKINNILASFTPLNLRWSQAGPISGMQCVRVHEDADPHAWSDNYLCSNQNLGLRWSQAGPISGMQCVRVHEDADPHAWSDNYLCSNQNLGLKWSQAGPISDMQCVRVHEDADPHAWSDNYLCH